jgi:hypothetical protein
MGVDFLRELVTPHLPSAVLDESDDGFAELARGLETLGVISAWRAQQLDCVMIKQTGDWIRLMTCSRGILPGEPRFWRVDAMIPVEDPPKVF